MKSSIFCMVITFFSYFNVFSQLNNHPTVDTLDVVYMSADNDQVIPEIVIHLKTWTGVSKVNWKIVDPTNNAIVYQVSYNILDMPVISENKTTLALVNLNLIQLLSTTAIQLKVYKYQILTEDEQGVQSSIYNFTKEIEL